MHSREYLAEQKRKGEAYLKERDARIAERKAVEREYLKDIKSLARSLVYPSASNAQPTQNAPCADDHSDSEYEPDAEEEAHGEEEDLRDEEEEVHCGFTCSNFTLLVSCVCHCALCVLKDFFTFFVPPLFLINLDDGISIRCIPI